MNLRVIFLTGGLSLMFGVYSMYQLFGYFQCINENHIEILKIIDIITYTNSNHNNSLMALNKRIDKLSEKINIFLVDDAQKNDIVIELHNIQDTITHEERSTLEISCETFFTQNSDNIEQVDISLEQTNTSPVGLHSTSPIDIDPDSDETETLTPVVKSDITNSFLDITTEDANKIIQDQNISPLQVDWFQATRHLTNYVIYGKNNN